MTTPVPHSQNPFPARESLAQEQSASAPGAARPTIDESTIAPVPQGPTTDGAHSVAHWIHEHPNAHKKGAGHVVYQVVRSAMASVPYGISMALTLGGLTKMGQIGKVMETGLESGAAKKAIGRGMQQAAVFGPVKTAALVATSFTFYRGTSKIVKWMTEYLFNPKDSEARTVEKLHDLPEEAWRKIKEVAPAEVSSTPVAAIVLGFVTSAFTKSKEVCEPGTNGVSLDWTRDNYKKAVSLGEGGKLLKSVIAHPKAKFVSQALINTIGYSLFFEMGDRLFKDKQIDRGVWPGEHNSIKALKAAPDEYQKGIVDNNTPSGKYTDSALEAKQSKSHYGFFTNEPGLGRFAFRRVLPTAVGIGAYTAAKFRWSAMTFNDFKMAADEQHILKKVPKLALTEGLATSLFFMIPLVAENWEKFYDKFFENLEKKAHARDTSSQAPDLSPHQQQKYSELLERVNAREQGTARVA